VANTRFAAAIEADRDVVPREFERGSQPPPPVANSRFAAAAAAAMAEQEDRPYRRRNPYDNDDRYHRGGGPPPVQTNSRFAAAAARAEEESMEYEQRRRDRDFGDRRGGGGGGGGGGDWRDDRGPPPIQQNSRFAAAVAADADYMDKDERERRRLDREELRASRGSGGGIRDRDRDSYHDRRANLPTGPRGDDYGRGDDFEELERRAQQEKSRVADVLKAKAPPPTENILNFPTSRPAATAASSELEANVLKVPEKPSKSQQDKIPISPKKEGKESINASPSKKETPPPPTNVKSDEVMAEFIRGSRLGDDLKEWTEQNRASLPPIETLVFELLNEREKLNPDPECAWAKPDQFGAALLALVEDDVVAQMRVLWGVQLYCDKIGFPKLNGESVVQSMFRAMYKFDLADSDAFMEWKDDESDAYSKGKLNAVIQTVDWFNWLEADDDEDEEGDDDDEE
jgi:hypothetical protein